LARIPASVIPQVSKTMFNSLIGSAIVPKKDIHY
jgi:hypothetical protein